MTMDEIIKAVHSNRENGLPAERLWVDELIGHYEALASNYDMISERLVLATNEFIPGHRRNEFEARWIKRRDELLAAKNQQEQPHGA